MELSVFQALIKDKIESIKDFILPVEVDNDLRKISQFRDVIQEYVSFIVNYIEYYELKEIKHRLEQKYHLDWLEEFLVNTKIERSLMGKVNFIGFSGFIYGPANKSLAINGHTNLLSYAEEAKQVSVLLYKDLQHYFMLGRPFKTKHLLEKSGSKKVESLDKSNSKDDTTTQLHLVFDGVKIYNKSNNSLFVLCRNAFPRQLLFALKESSGQGVVARLIDPEYKSKLKELRKNWASKFNVTPQSIGRIIQTQGNMVRATSFLSFEGF